MSNSNELQALEPYPRVRGQVAIVTGGGRGIGSAICQKLAHAGATVVIADIDAEGSQATADSLAPDSSAVVRNLDVTNEDQVRELITSVAADYGRVDLLVNSAGVAIVTPLKDASLESWRKTFAVNVEGALLTMRYAAAVMMEQSPSEQTQCRGKIVNISSPAAGAGRPLLSAYGASKAALNSLSKSAAVSWGDQSISTTIIYPTTVKDAMWPRLGEEMAVFEGRPASEIFAERIEGSPTGRFQEPSEVADAVLFAANFRGMRLNSQIVWTEAHVSQA